MRRLLLIIVITAMGMGRAYSQALIQTYVDRCTGQVSVFTVPMNGQTVVAFYNKSRTFTAAQFQNGELQAWLEETWLWWNALSPCSTTGGTVVNTTQQTQQTTQQATEAAANATNVANQTAATNNIPDATSTNVNVPSATEAPTTTVPDTTTSTPDTSVPDTTTSTPDTSTPDTSTSQPTTTESSQGSSQPDTSSTEGSASTETQSTETTTEASSSETSSGGESSQETSQESSSESTEVESTESTESTETESTETESTETESTESESTESESTESESSESESESTESESDDSTESESESETESESESESESDETTEEESTEEESTEEESTEEESENEESDEEQSEEESEEESESDEESEEDSEEESDEEESDEEESEDDEEESEEEETSNEDEEEDDEDKKKKRAFAPPVLAANVLSQQGVDGKYSYATMFGISQTTLLGTETFGANLMVYDNLEQFMLNLNYSKVHINDEGRVNRVYSAALGGMKMFTSYMATMNHSMVWMGKKGLVGGFALGTTITSVELDVREGYIYYDDIVLAGSLTGFATKPFKYNDRLTISPMVAVSSPFITQSLTNYDTTWNTDVMVIGGTNFNYMFTQRFGLTLGTTVIDATIKDFPTMVNFMIGGRLSF